MTPNAQPATIVPLEARQFPRMAHPQVRARPEERTQFAQSATVLALHLNGVFGKAEPLNGYRFEVTSPEGRSTGGGQQSVQRLRLLPKSGGPALVMGSLDTRKNTAVLRTADHLAFQSGRHGQRMTLDAAAYEQLSAKVRRVLERWDFAVAVEQGPEVHEVWTQVVLVQTNDRLRRGLFAGAAIAATVAAVASQFLLQGL